MVSASEEDDNGNGGTMSSDETAGDFYSEYECVEELGRGLSSGKGTGVMVEVGGIILA